MAVQTTSRQGRTTAPAAGRRFSRTVAATFSALMFSLAACGSDARQDASTESGGDVDRGAMRADAPDSSRGSPKEGRIDATIAGPAFAGRHQVRDDMQCTSTAGIWQAGFENGRKTGLSAALVMLQGIPASGGTSDNTTLTLTFGDPMTEVIDTNAGLVQLHPRALGFDAHGTVKREGKGAVITVEGTAQGAGRVTVVVHCASVDFVD